MSSFGYQVAFHWLRLLIIDDSVSAYVTILDSNNRLLNTASFWNDQHSSAAHDQSVRRLTSLLIIPYLAI